jgi:glycosyltransferase involved in cell wall biosynthesis
MPKASSRHEISVVIPTYNRSLFLPKALDSVYNQTYPNLEVIVVDDGSSDNTLPQLALQFPPVIWVQQDNHGVSHARNQGIQKARGEWIAFLDSDDIWHPQKLERQIDFLKKNPGLSMCHTDEEWIRNGQKVKTPSYLDKTDHQLFSRSLDRCIICPSSVLIQKAMLVNIGKFDESLPVCEDYDLWLRILISHQVGYLPEELVTKNGGHEDQLSRKHWGMDRFRVQSLKKLITQPCLSLDQRIEILKSLIKKLNLLAKGFIKHGKISESEEFQKEMRYFSKQLLSYSTKQTTSL